MDAWETGPVTLDSGGLVLVLGPVGLTILAGLVWRVVQLRHRRLEQLRAGRRPREEE